MANGHSESEEFANRPDFHVDNVTIAFGHPAELIVGTDGGRVVWEGVALVGPNLDQGAEYIVSARMTRSFFDANRIVLQRVASNFTVPSQIPG